MATRKCLLFLSFLAVVAPAIQAQDNQTGSNSLITIPAVNAEDQLGFISLDCGSPENYTDKTTGINYISDSNFIQSGTSHTISPSLFNTDSVPQQLTNLRAFNQGTRNCYTLKIPTNSTYLIRASFLYGNYDSTSQLPTFDLHLGVDHWDSVAFTNTATPSTFEIIRYLSLNNIDVCLIKTGSSTPFISSLELRLLNNTMYRNAESGALRLFRRYNFDTKTKLSVRYKDDLYDRIWLPHVLSNVTTLNTDSNITYNSYQVPPAVIRSVATPRNASESLQFYWDSTSSSEQYHICIHFAEVVPLQANQSRQFTIFLNGEIFYENIVPEYLLANTIYTILPLRGEKRYVFSLNQTVNSTLPPIINAVEVYTYQEVLNMETEEATVSAMLKIKSMYGITKNWQGDPCSPQTFIWDGLNCSRNGSQGPRITSLSLSRSGINGTIAPSIANLTSLKYLDLSNNNLTGEVPDFLGRLPLLTTINLKGNNFTGSIPAQLLDKSRKGVLLLSIDDTDSNRIQCESAPCKKKKNKILLPASVAAGSFMLCVVLAIALFMIARGKQQGGKVSGTNKTKEKSLTKNREFTYSEVLRITNNFDKVIGKGGFGTVYHGFVGDTEVAVKMLSPSSTQGYKEFQAEASLLMSVHHKNVSTLVGYCDEGTNMGIIYEYMANGNLDQHLSDKNLDALVWEERLKIATDAAHGLEYLHHGCKLPIIHRDVKSNNILLNEKFQAKLTDFGLSRAFNLESDTHVSTVVAGTPGYLDPEYFISNRLTEKSDVYGFGIVLLEIITGRSAITKSTERMHIVQWVSTSLDNGDISNIVDPRLKIDFDIDSAKQVMVLAMACASRVSSERPTMTEVVSRLNACLAAYMANTTTYHTASPNVQDGLVSDE